MKLKKKLPPKTIIILVSDIKLLVSNEISFGEENYKYFIGYLYNVNKIKPSNYNAS